MNSSPLLRAAIATALYGFCVMPALADEAALRAQVESLRTALAEQRVQLETQAKLLQAQQEQLDALTRQLGQPKPAASASPTLTFNNNRPSIAAADGNSSLAIRSLVQLDSALYGESPSGPLQTDFRRGSTGTPPNREIDAARDMSNGAYFRRARFGVEGVLARDFDYRLILELGGSGSEGPTRINDAWIAYSGLAPFTFQLGAYSPPANMDDGTSPEDTLFLERASSAELSRAMGGADGRIGLGTRASGERWMGSFTMTTRTVNDAEVFDSQLAAVGRAGFLAATGADYNLHLGASGTYVFQLAEQGLEVPVRNPNRLRDRPEIRVDSLRLIDTGVLDAEHASVYGVEFGANWRNFYLQGEHFWYGIERSAASPLPDPDFSGYYLQGSWILTGEQRRYNAGSGSFRSPRAKNPVTAGGGFGAWELAARYSVLDLNFAQGLEGTAAPPGSVRGGEQQVWTVGLNWYLNSSFKMMLDYMLIDVDRLNPAGVDNPQPFGAPPNTPPPGVQIGQDLDVWALRSQFSF